MAFVFPVNTRNRSKFYDEQAKNNRQLIQESHDRETTALEQRLDNYKTQQSSLPIENTYKEELKRVLHEDSLSGDHAFFAQNVITEYIGHLEEKNNIERSEAIITACRSFKERGVQPTTDDLVTEVWKNMKELGKPDQEVNAVIKSIRHFQESDDRPTVKAFNAEVRKNIHDLTNAPTQPKISKANSTPTP